MSSAPRSYKTVSEIRESRQPESGSSSDDTPVTEETSGIRVLPGSIEAALACFDVEAANAATSNPRSAGGIAQFMARGEIKSEIHSQVITVPRMPAAARQPKNLAVQQKTTGQQKCAPAQQQKNTCAQPKSPVERDSLGRVIAVRFGAGDTADFRYDSAGMLCAFTYGGLTWLREDAGFWRSGDRQVDYRIDGEVSVLHDGSIRIARPDVVRTLRTSGVRIDEHRDGSRTESRKLRNAPTPFDLLAKSKPVSSVWLSSAPASYDQERIAAIQLFEAAGEVMDHGGVVDGLVSSSRNRMFTSETVVPLAKVESNLRGNDAHKSIKGAPFVQEPQADRGGFPAARGPAETSMLRNAVSRVPAVRENKSMNERWHCAKRDTTECVFKTLLWANALVRGQSSPSLIPLLDGLAAIYGEKHQNDDAETMHLRALSIKESYYGTRQPELAINVSGLADIYRRRHNFSRAEQMYKEAMRLHEKSVRKNLFLFSQGVFDEAKLTREIDALFRCIAGLADTYETQKKSHATRELYEAAMTLWTEIAQKTNHKLDVVLETIVERYVAVIKNNKPREAQRPTKMIPTAS